MSYAICDAKQNHHHYHLFTVVGPTHACTRDSHETAPTKIVSVMSFGNKRMIILDYYNLCGTFAAIHRDSVNKQLAAAAFMITVVIHMPTIHKCPIAAFIQFMFLIAAAAAVERFQKPPYFCLLFFLSFSISFLIFHRLHWEIDSLTQKVDSLALQPNTQDCARCLCKRLRARIYGAVTERLPASLSLHAQLNMIKVCIRN